MKINEKNLIAYSILREHIDKEGFLFQKGEVTKIFQRRWFILKGNLLFYFDKKGDKEPVGVIILEGCTTELAESEEYFVFKLIFSGERSRTYILAAETQELLESWMRCISRASYDYLKLMVAELQKQLEEIDEFEKDNDKGSGSCLVSPVSLCSQSSAFGRPRENPFNKIEDECSYSDLWISNESLHNAASLLCRASSVKAIGSEILGVNSSLPPCVPFRPAPPPPKINFTSNVRPPRKSFAELHYEYGIVIKNDKQDYQEVKLRLKKSFHDQELFLDSSADNHVYNLIDL